MTVSVFSTSSLLTPNISLTPTLTPTLTLIAAGLGKTVQVMALIAYLMEHKNTFGPHLIIVPNAVVVNWKAELQTWLPSARCIFYVGKKDERARQFTQEVLPQQFNVLVTTYELIMKVSGGSAV